MAKKKLYRGNRGLKFKYKIEGINKVLTDRYQTIEDFLKTDFPKNGNLMSPKNDTKIFDITWNANKATINNEVKTLSDLRNILSGDYYITNTDIRLTESNLIRKSIHSIEEMVYLFTR